MGLLSKLFGKNKPQKTLEESTLVEANVCPNCWGTQEYDNQFFEYVEDQTKSNINQTKSNINQDKTHQKAFVQQFVETHVTGIRLKREGEDLYCPKCKGKYKHVSSKAN